jgi:hypothetical protein
MKQFLILVAIIIVALLVLGCDEAQPDNGMTEEEAIDYVCTELVYDYADDYCYLCPAMNSLTCGQWYDNHIEGDYKGGHDMEGYLVLNGVKVVNHSCNNWQEYCPNHHIPPN